MPVNPLPGLLCTYWNYVLHMQGAYTICACSYYLLENDDMYQNVTQARINLSYSSQCETSGMRVSFERPRKKIIIICIHKNIVYLLTAMDADTELSGS